MSPASQIEIPEKLYFKIGEVAKIVGVKPYVLRYWETEFKEIEPIKSGTNQRRYRRRDVELLTQIKRFLYEEGFTINGARKKIREHLRPSGRAKSTASKTKEKGQVQQVPFAFADEGSKKLLKKVKQELEEVRKILATA